MNVENTDINSFVWTIEPGNRFSIYTTVEDVKEGDLQPMTKGVHTYGSKVAYDVLG